MPTYSLESIFFHNNIYMKMHSQASFFVVWALKNVKYKHNCPVSSFMWTILCVTILGPWQHSQAYGYLLDN